MNLEEIKQKLHTPNSRKVARDAAVLLPLVSINSEIHVLFQVRALTLNAQPGETCFPGGRIDQSDENPQAAALREFYEEFGIPEKDVNVLAPMSKIESPRRGLIHPFIAYVHSIDHIQPNKDEVEDWFTIPVSYLLSHEPEVGYVDVTISPGANFPIDRIANPRAYREKQYSTAEYFYRYENHMVWGLTARILQEFISHMKR
ncbi:CoA pyrophosphatase [Alkalihalobacillus sp. LMS6]|uniref:NUDIX hydrolase n=1 Tax=Bacillaceae TaxID=186817 RepID=UPI000C0856E6|nr:MULTISPECIES: CoA pyrophosphatase [Bacillaceae]UTR07884.1 CoA pyrophosphatase [Alkalihalobacillus sp. LMS6]